VEQKHFVECGKIYFADDRLNFYYDLESCLKEQQSSAIVFSGVLQYLEKPYNLIGDIINKKFKYVIFDRTSFLNRGSDLITVQKIPFQIFKASYPCWFLNINEFKNKLLRNYELTAEFNGFEQADVIDSIFKGFIFKKRQDDIEAL
jgi:putative methyltransferase (TIGR04325 family)